MLVSKARERMVENRQASRRRTGRVEYGIAGADTTTIAKYTLFHIQKLYSAYMQFILDTDKEGLDSG